MIFKPINECRVQLIAHTDFVKGHEQSMDTMPVVAARVSFAKDHQDADEHKDLKLIKYLAEHQHLTPFEYQHATFMIECPLFIRSQIHRHRTFSYNEISRRYTSDDLEFWIPETFRQQAKSNKQASEGEIDEETNRKLLDWYKRNCYDAFTHYNSFIQNGVGREMARAVLPQALLTRFYMGGNLRNWAHFIELRTDPHAQYEVQVIANRIKESLLRLWPNSCGALFNA